MKFLIFVTALLFGSVAFASDFPVPNGDVAAMLLQLATSYKTLGTLGILSILTVITVQAIKKFAPEEWRFKRLTTLAVSIVWAILSGLAMPGASIHSVLLTVFMTSGGAVALYEAMKGAKLIKAE